MKRISILLVALLALVVAACSSNQASSAEPSESTAATQEATPEPSQPASSAPASSDGSGSVDSALLDLVPDQIGGMARTDLNFADNPIFAQALAGSGVDASEVEYVVSTWGEGEVTLSSMRIPGMEQTALETLAASMAGVPTAGGEVETTTVGGKTVLQMTGEGAPSAAYIYFSSGAMFTVVSESPELAEEVLSALP